MALLNCFFYSIDEIIEAVYLAFGQSFAEMLFFFFAVSESSQVIRSSQMLNLFSFQSELLKLFCGFPFMIPTVSRSLSHAVLMVRSAIQADIIIFLSKPSVVAVGFSIYKLIKFSPCNRSIYPPISVHLCLAVQENERIRLKKMYSF